MIKEFQILGERCSGTTYLARVLELNFNIKQTQKFHSKHFFGFNDYNNSDDVLFIGIVRNAHTWINSLYNQPWHLSYNSCKNTHAILNNEIYSMYPHESRKDKTKTDLNKHGNKQRKEGDEMLMDRNIYTGERYKNIFDLRYTKLHYQLNDMPKKVKYYIFIKYEDLRDNFIETMNKFKQIKELSVKNIEKFPINTSYYKTSKRIFKINTNNEIKEIDVINHNDFNVETEKSIGY